MKEGRKRMNFHEKYSQFANLIQLNVMIRLIAACIKISKRRHKIRSESHERGCTVNDHDIFMRNIGSLPN